MRSKDVNLKDNFGFHCEKCRGIYDAIVQDSYRSWCYCCNNCQRLEMVKSVLGREYRKELAGVHKSYKHKFLDMMVRDAVRENKRRLQKEADLAHSKQFTFDEDGVVIE